MKRQKKIKRMLVLAAVAVLAVLVLIRFAPWKNGQTVNAPERACSTPFPQRENALTGEAFFPENDANWTYHFVYAYPSLPGEGYAAAAVNDTYKTALDEMLHLVLPMFANEEAMRYDGNNEIIHDFEVCCDNGRFFSVLQKRSQTRGAEPPILTLEAQTFDMAGEYLGETLTLRGVVMVGDSSDQLGAALYPVLYEEFRALQASGVCKAEMEWEDFELEFDPTRDFYCDENGNAVFFFSPEMLTEPSFAVPVFTYSPAELEGLLAK